MLDFSSAGWFLALQYIYTFWQAVRNTRGFNLIYYTTQCLILRLLWPESRRKRIVWVNPTHSSAYFSWERNWEELSPELMTGKKQIPGFKFLDYKAFWYKVEYRGKFYWVHQDIFFELYSYDLTQCYFVKNLYDLDRNYSVAERITEEEAMLMMFNKNMHLYEVEDPRVSGISNVRDIRKRTVIHGREFNIEFNSKLGGFLAVIPIILQARDLNAISAIASLFLLAFDFLRTPIYNAYDTCFFYATKFVKLHVFRKRTWLYTLFGLFSDRWKYSDFKKGYAYLTKEWDRIEVTSYVSCLSAEDCELETLKDYGKLIPDMQRFAIRDGVISSSGFTYGQFSAVFKVKVGMYVS